MFTSCNTQEEIAGILSVSQSEISQFAIRNSKLIIHIWGLK